MTDVLTQKQRRAAEAVAQAYEKLREPDGFLSYLDARADRPYLSVENDKQEEMLFCHYSDHGRVMWAMRMYLIDRSLPQSIVIEPRMRCGLLRICCKNHRKSEVIAPIWLHRVVMRADETRESRAGVAGRIEFAGIAAMVREVIR